MMSNVVLYAKYSYNNIPIRIFGVQHFKKNEKKDKSCPKHTSEELSNYVQNKIKNNKGLMDIYLETNYIYRLSDKRNFRGINYYSWGLDPGDPLLTILNINQKCFYEDKRDSDKFYQDCPIAFNKNKELITRFHYVDARFTEDKDDRDPHSFLFTLIDYLEKTKDEETINILLKYIDHCLFNTRFDLIKTQNKFINEHLNKFIFSQMSSSIFKNKKHRITIQLEKLDKQLRKDIENYFRKQLDSIKTYIFSDSYYGVLDLTSVLMDCYLIARMMRFLPGSKGCIVIVGMYHAEFYIHFLNYLKTKKYKVKKIFESEPNEKLINCSKFKD